MANARRSGGPQSRRQGAAGGAQGAPERREARGGKGVDFDRSWDMLACYGPRPEVWRVSACGTVFAVWRQPDGREAFLGAWLSLGEGGLRHMFGAVDRVAGDGALQRARIAPSLPPMVEMAREAAAEYLYGALAWAGDRPAVPEALRHTRSVAEPVGGPGEWLARLAGPAGLTPPELVRVIRQNGPSDDVPDGKEALTVTAVTVAVAPGSGPRVARRLLERRGAPEFFQTGGGPDETVLDWFRPYPQGRRPLIDGPGARQAMGSLTVRDAEVELSAMTLSRVSVLMEALLGAADGCAPRTVSAKWKGVDDIVRPQVPFCGARRLRPCPSRGPALAHDARRDGRCGCRPAGWRRWLCPCPDGPRWCRGPDSVGTGRHRRSRVR